jgi:hypothetical protein
MSRLSSTQCVSPVFIIPKRLRSKGLLHFITITYFPIVLGSGEESVDELRTLVVKLFLKYKVKIPNIANVYYARSRSVRLSPIIVVLDSVFAAREVLGSFSRRQLEDDVVVEAKLEGKELRNRAHAKGVSKGSISSQ